MDMQLTAEQKEHYAMFRHFADKEIAPLAAQFDNEECIPIPFIQEMAQRGFIGSILPEDVGGMGLDMVTFGLLNEQFGRACSSVRSLITVHSMVSFAINRWGRKAHKEQWLPLLATGEKIGAFALTEPNVGSDAKRIETVAEKQGDRYVLNGRKKWITFGQIADLFLIFALSDDKPMAFLVERERPGIELVPMKGLLGTRGSMLAEIILDDCEIPVSNTIGGRGFGFAGVALSALNIGRYSVAWGCVGIGQACLEASLDYIGKREQFGVAIEKHQLIRQMISNMYAHVKAARLLSYHAGILQEQDHMHAIQETLVAKYFASVMANQAASDAVQVHGGNGCGSEYPVGRYYRDAKVMEIIEGSTQMQQIMIGKHAYQAFQAGNRLDELAG